MPRIWAAKPSLIECLATSAKPYRISSGSSLFAAALGVRITRVGVNNAGAASTWFGLTVADLGDSRCI